MSEGWGHSIGEISVGDTSIQGLSTMPTNEAEKKASRYRKRALSRSENGSNSISSAGKTLLRKLSSKQELNQINSKVDSGNEVIIDSFESDSTDSTVYQRKKRNEVKKNSSEKDVLDNKDVSLSFPMRLYYNYREVTYRNKWLKPLIWSLIPPFLYWMGKGTPLGDFIHPFLFLSYHIPAGTDPSLVEGASEDLDMYGKGLKDLLEFMMQMVLFPIATKLNMHKIGKRKRFMEQAYSMFYYGISGPIGLLIMHHMPLWYFKTSPFYEFYPHKSHEWDFKAFYLLQAAFWSQQSILLSLQVEKPRKDFKELVFHHIVTIALISTSYIFHFTWMGLAIYITMDVSDFFLAAAKILNYLQSSATEAFFAFFVLVWIYCRHYLNLVILWSVLTEFKTVGPYELDFSIQQYKCWISQIITFILIFALQLVNLYWLFLICRIAYRAAFKGVKKDERSDDEDDED